jgi:hypothetical protein
VVDQRGVDQRGVDQRGVHWRRGVVSDNDGGVIECRWRRRAEDGDRGNWTMPPDEKMKTGEETASDGVNFKRIGLVELCLNHFGSPGLT